MTLLSLSLSHRTASLDTLARVSLVPDEATKLCQVLGASEHIQEVTVLSTCNRVEVYADVDRFHAGLDEVVSTLSQVSGVPLPDLHNSCAVHFDEGSVAHAFGVAAGLESMVVGEPQVLGQFREALQLGQQAGTVGSSLNSLFQQGIRVAKRVHTVTDIGLAGRGLVDAAWELVASSAADPSLASSLSSSLAGQTVLVAGAGQMAGAAARRAAAAGARVLVVNRTFDRGARLAEELADAQALPWDQLGAALAQADIVFSCTGANGFVIGPADLTDSPATVVIDMAMPPDVDPAVAELPGVSLIDLATLQHSEQVAQPTAEIAKARDLVSAEVRNFVASRHARQVTPTVVALRSLADEIVAAELGRLNSKLPELDEAVRAEVRQTVTRVAHKLLHSPTVRVQEYAGGEVDYAAALRTLFSLDPHAIAAVTSPEVAG